MSHQDERDPKNGGGRFRFDLKTLLEFTALVALWCVPLAFGEVAVAILFALWTTSLALAYRIGFRKEAWSGALVAVMLVLLGWLCVLCLLLS